MFYFNFFAKKDVVLRMDIRDWCILGRHRWEAVFSFFFAQQGAQSFSLEVVCIFVCVFRAEGVCPPWPLPHLYRHPSVYWLMKNSWVCVWEQRNNFQYLASYEYRWCWTLVYCGGVREGVWGRMCVAGIVAGWGQQAWVIPVTGREGRDSLDSKPTITNAAAVNQTIRVKE